MDQVGTIGQSSNEFMKENEGQDDEEYVPEEGSSDEEEENSDDAEENDLQEGRIYICFI